MQQKQGDQDTKRQDDQRREAEKAIFAKLVETQQQGHDGDIIAREAKYYEV